MDSGYQNEFDIMKFLNEKKYKDLDTHWRKMVKFMFPNIRKRDVIHSMMYYDNASKPDIIVGVNNKNIFLSIKTGRVPSVHEERVDSFLKFLGSLGVSARTLKIIRFYHYGYSPKLSNNGVPFTREQIMERFGKNILEANKELNTDYVIKKVAHRCVIKGAKIDREEIDFFYYGVLNKGFILSKNDIYEMISKDRSDEHRGIHIGGLIYQPSTRQVSNYRNDYVKIKWPVLCVKFYKDDII